MKTLYIHGLDSEPRKDKLEILAKAGLDPIALHLDYRNETDAYLLLLHFANTEQVKFIVGSSMGGLLGLYLAAELQIPSLLFNPALAMTSVEMKLPKKQDFNSPLRMVVLGDKDKIINPNKNYHLLRKEYKSTSQKIIRMEWLPHSIDIQTFEESIHWASYHLRTSSFL